MIKEKSAKKNCFVGIILKRKTTTHDNKQQVYISLNLIPLVYKVDIKGCQEEYST